MRRDDDRSWAGCLMLLAFLAISWLGLYVFTLLFCWCFGLEFRARYALGVVVAVMAVNIFTRTRLEIK